MSSKIETLKNSKGYTKNEEIANSITHGIGALLSIGGMTVLVVFASLWGDVWRVVSLSIYGTTLIILYLSSTLYHFFSNPGVKNVFQIFDHSAIFLLIAGTYTPFTLVTIRGGWGWSIFGVIWGIAVIGIVLKTFYTGRFNLVSTILYIVMGWLVVIAIKPIVNNLPGGGIAWLFIGGCCYTFGVIFYAWEKLPYNHAVWHLFVLAGSIAHFFAILLYVLPMEKV